MKRALWLGPVAIVLTACGGVSGPVPTMSGSFPAASSASSSSSTSTECKPFKPQDSVGRAVNSIDLGKLQVSGVDSQPDADVSSLSDVVITVCGDSSVTGDSLKDWGTKIARGLKSGSASGKVAQLEVDNGSASGDSSKVRSEDFQQHTYKGDASQERRLWKTAAEQ